MIEIRNDIPVPLVFDKVPTYYEKNREKQLAAAKAWQAANPDRKKATRKAYYHANKEKEDAETKAWKLANPDKVKAFKRKSSYGITQKQYDELLIKQDSKCAICLNQLDLGKYTHIDHCHKTNKVRGLLCHHCNLFIGNAKENISYLENAIKYLGQEF